MKISQSNLRTCLVTRKKYDKSELIRIVKTKNGEFSIDLDNSLQGRGCYVKASKENFQILKEKRLLNRSLKCDVPMEIYNKLLDMDL